MRFVMISPGCNELTVIFAPSCCICGIQTLELGMCTTGNAQRWESGVQFDGGRPRKRTVSSLTSYEDFGYPQLMIVEK